MEWIKQENILNGIQTKNKLLRLNQRSRAGYLRGKQSCENGFYDIKSKYIFTEFIAPDKHGFWG